ncbi:MAG: helix-turn-helix transcriptional regulator [Phycisphaeraceae bacterium]|nr:MAG: helix-turn-helix transcriptional regulator [Phycisphaeraceae bacterium]
MTRQLDRTFHALSNATRRAVVERLRQSPATVSELAAPFGMSLPSFMDHLQVLEQSGLVRSRKRGRVRTVRIVPRRLRQAAAWLDQQRAIWEQRLDQLDAYVKTMEKHDESSP